MLWAALLLTLAQPPADHAFPEHSKLRGGILIGNPLSLTVATDLSEGLVLQLDVGLAHSDDFSGIMGIDVVYRSETIFGRVLGDLWLMPWFGFGARGAIEKGEDEDRFGFRVPVGISVLSDLDAVEVYFETAIGLSIFPDRRASIDYGFGIRAGF